jgi:hypothetical protein
VELQRHIEEYQEDRAVISQIRHQVNDLAMQYGEDRVEIDRFISQFMEGRRQKRDNAQMKELQRKEEQYERVRKWFSEPQILQQDYHLEFQQIRQKFPETAKWILESDKIMNWIDGEIAPHPIIWINGKKGAGMLANSPLVPIFVAYLMAKHSQGKPSSLL